MADEWSELIEGEVLDCSSISISYQANGLAQVSFTVFRPEENGPPYSTGGPGFELCAGGVQFKGWVTQQTMNPSADIDFIEWQVSAIAIGCKNEDGCGAEC